MINKKYSIAWLICFISVMLFVPIITNSTIPPTNSFSIINANDTDVDSDSYKDTIHFTSNDSILFNATDGNSILVETMHYTELEGFEYRKKITIDNTMISGSIPHTNFPMLVLIENDSNLNSTAVQSNGEDIRFTSSDGITLLDYEIQSFTNDITSGNLISWVSIPTLPTDTDTHLYLYYSNSTISDGQNPNAVWSDYQYVAHLNNEITAGYNVLDSTTNPKNGISSGVTLVDGKIGKAYDFDGNNDVIIFNPVNSGGKMMMDNSDISISVIIKPNLSGDNYQRIFSKSTASSATNGYDFTLNGSELILYIDGNRSTQSNDVITDNTQFYHLTITKKHNVLEGNAYINGIDETDILNTNNVIPDEDTNMIIGSWNTSLARMFNGLIEELTISKIIPTHDRVITEFNNKMNPDSFYSISSQESNITIMSHQEFTPNMINFTINSPTETRLGGVFAITCPSNEFLSGLNSDGTLICSILP